MEWLPWLFDGTTIYAGGAILALIAILVVCAFGRGGQSSSAAEDRLAAERAAAGPAAATAGRVGPARGTFLLAAPVAASERAFEVSEAGQFYQAIAPNYDQGTPPGCWPRTWR